MAVQKDFREVTKLIAEMATSLQFRSLPTVSLDIMDYESAAVASGPAESSLPAQLDRTDEAAIHPSPAVLALLDRVRTRFGLPLEFLDSGLRPVSPALGDHFHAAMLADPEVRRRASAVLKSGRADAIATAAGTYQVQAIRSQGRGRRTLGLLALGSESGGGATDAWADILRTTLDADLAAVRCLRDERLDARRATAALRFFGQILTVDSEAELTRAIIHAAAVWFDVDARMYRRTLVGDYVLDAHLPGAQGAPDSQLSLGTVPAPGKLRRIPFSDLPEEFRWSAGDVVLAMLPVGDEDEWVLALGGHLPPASETLVAALAQSLAGQLASRSQRWLQHVRNSVHATVVREEPTEQIAFNALRLLIDLTHASAGVLTMHEGGQARQLAVYGSANPVSTLPHEPLLAADQFVLPMPLGHGRTAVIDLRSDTSFTLNDSRALRAAAGIMHAWLAGSGASLRSRTPSPEARSANGFAQRITEELERAKRFDLGLAVVVIDLLGSPALGPTMERVLAAVRNELRGSDLLGVLDDGRIAALLVHTDAAGMSSVLPRLRRRVADLTHTLGVPFPRLGPAVFSDECRTASTLLSKAMQNLEVVEQGGRGL
jgi:hypothetical protein